MLCEAMLSVRNLPRVWSEEYGNWESRRKEIEMLMQREVYGYLPDKPEALSFTELPPEPWYNNFCAGKVSLKKILLSGKLNGKAFSFPFYSAIPSHKKQLPFFIHINFRPDVPDRYMPVEEITDNGFALFSFGYQDITADNDDFSDGLAGVWFGGRKREGSDCGKIALWAWMASRIMDYCMTLDCLDFKKSIVIGHSRLGKTALFTGMMDQRFQYIVSNESGCAGAAISRCKEGETVGKIYRSFPYWFAPAFGKYAEKEDDMPFDQHFLLAACAPRYVYVASATEDLWSDPASEYLSCCAADKVYERLRLTGFIHPDRLPEPGDAFHDGHIGYHLRSGLHYLSRMDWLNIIRFINLKN